MAEKHLLPRGTEESATGEYEISLLQFFEVGLYGWYDKCN